MPTYVVMRIGFSHLLSANSTTVVELIVELIGELFIVELLNYNFSDLLNTLSKVFLQCIILNDAFRNYK